MKLVAEKVSLKAERYDAAVIRGGFGTLQVVALEALQLAGLRPQLLVGFSRIRIFVTCY